MGLFSPRRSLSSVSDRFGELLKSPELQEAISADSTIVVIPLDGCSMQLNPFDPFYAEVGPTDGRQGTLTLSRLLWERRSEDGREYLAARVRFETAVRIASQDVQSGISQPVGTEDGDLLYLMQGDWAVMRVIPD